MPPKKQVGPSLEERLDQEEVKPEPTIAKEEVKEKPSQKMVQISEAEWNKVQDQLKMLYETADKGRIFNYENQRAQKKALQVKLSIYNGMPIVGWATLKDQAVYHPTTGKQVGEEQQYEIMLLDKEGKITKAVINGYPNFSEARYTERIDCTVTGKKEDYEGNVTYDVQLPDGRVIPLNARFVN